MIKFILLVVLIGFVFFRILGFFLRLLTNSSVDQRGRSQQFNRSGQGRQAQSAKGNVTIDYVPGKRNGKPEKFKGGEYVDFEEVE